MTKKIKRNYDRGYVDASDKIRVFIESRAKVMFVEHDYRTSESARAAYRQSKGELFLIRKDI